MKNRFSFLYGNRSYLTSWIVALFAVFALASCGGNGGGTTPSTASTVTGLIQDAAGMPVAAAQVQIARQTAMTAADGRFSFSVTSSSEPIVLLVKKAGYATNAKDVPLKGGGTTDIAIKIFSDQVNTTFSASAGATLSLANGASAVIPANGLQTASGAAFTGTVHVEASYFGPDTLDGVQAFPAPYVGTDAGVQSPLITAGVIEVKLTDASGNPLQPKAGSPATLTYPATSASADAASIPMWFYDEANGIWVREGVASKQVSGTYQASVTHFTLWNLDFKGEIATIIACFKDTFGKPVSATGSLGLRGNGWDMVFYGKELTPDGVLTIIRVPAGIPLELHSNAQPGAFSALAIPSLAPGEVRHLACAVVTNPQGGSTVVLTPPSTLFTTTAGSFAGTYSGNYIGAEQGSFTVFVDSFGQITGSVTSTTFQGSGFAVTGTVGASGTVSMLATGQAGSASFQGAAFGAGLISGTWMYTSGPGGNGTFSGQRN